MRNRTPDREVTTVFGTACRPFGGTIRMWSSRQESNLRRARLRRAALFRSGTGRASGQAVWIRTIDLLRPRQRRVARREPLRQYGEYCTYVMRRARRPTKPKPLNERRPVLHASTWTAFFVSVLIEKEQN